MVCHLVCLFYINIYDNMVCFLLCFYIKMFVWLLFPLFSNRGVLLHSLYTKFNLTQRIDKCIYVFSLWHRGVLANVGKYWQFYVCVLHLYCGPFAVPFLYLWHVGMLFSVLLCHIICMASFNFFSNMGVPLCVLHLHGGPFGLSLKKNIFDNMVCFLVCLFVKIFVWLLFSLFSDMGVPLHSLYTQSNLIQRIDKCIYVFSLWHSGVLANVGKYW